MTAAEATVKKGGVIVMLARSNDGHGGEEFFRCISKRENIEETMQEILARKRNETIPDQWESQILLRILLHATVIYVSDAPDEMIKAMHMHPAHSLQEGIALAKKLVGADKPTITAIPDGVAVMVVGE